MEARVRPERVDTGTTYKDHFERCFTGPIVVVAAYFVDPATHKLS